MTISIVGLDWDHKKRLKGVYRIVGGSHKGWSKFVDHELGNYDYLLGADVRMSASSVSILSEHVSRLITAIRMYGKTSSHGESGC